MKCLDVLNNPLLLNTTITTASKERTNKHIQQYYLDHALQQSIDLVLAVTEITTLDEVICLPEI